MRRFIIDTDTASDDAVAIILALKDPDVKVEAITVVAGNVPLKTAVRNALISAEMAGTYVPPVYVGRGAPLMRDLITAQDIHGMDGLGDVGYADPVHQPAEGHAVDAIIRLAGEVPGLEIITLGPLTNVAMAFLQAPEVMKNIKHIYTMGGQYKLNNPYGPAAEFNIMVDAEAAKIVLASGVHVTLIPLDVCHGGAEINEAEMAQLRALNTKVGDFFIDCNRTLTAFLQKMMGRTGIPMPDPTAVAVALNPDMMEEKYEVFADVEVKSPFTYGEILYDFLNTYGKLGNCTLCAEIDVARFKKLVFDSAK